MILNAHVLLFQKNDHEGAVKGTLKRKRFQNSKKMGCSAKLSIQRLVVYTEYCVKPEMFKSWYALRKARTNALADLRGNLTDAKYEMMSEITLPSNEQHHGHGFSDEVSELPQFQFSFQRVSKEFQNSKQKPRT